MAPEFYKEKVYKELKNFFELGKGWGSSNKWFEWAFGSFYFRYQHKKIEDKVTQVLCLATISVGKNYQRKGFFKMVISIVERLSVERGEPVFIENVMNPCLEVYLHKRGYKMESDKEINPVSSYYLFPKELEPSI